LINQDSKTNLNEGMFPPETGGKGLEGMLPRNNSLKVLAFWNSEKNSVQTERVRKSYVLSGTF